jgi:hypothetical protein
MFSAAIGCNFFVEHFLFFFFFLFSLLGLFWFHLQITILGSGDVKSEFINGSPVFICTV